MWSRDRATGVYTWVSEGYRELFDLDPAELIGKTPYQAFAPDVAKTYDEGDQVCFAGKSLIRPVKAQHGTSGERITIMTKKFPVFDGAKVVAAAGYSYTVDMN